MTRSKLEWYFDARANHDADDVVIEFPANELQEIFLYLGNLHNL